jgi:hypothetical protein
VIHVVTANPAAVPPSVSRAPRSVDLVQQTI